MVDPMAASLSLTEEQSYTAADATAAFNAFNTYYYNPTAKLYYSNTDQDDIGAIWTQAIYWDIAMHRYIRTGDEVDLSLVHDIYQGGYDQYDGYNWENTTEWFIYDDIMWWVIALARAYELTENPVYLEKSISGFARVWRDSYDPVDGGMYWSFDHTGKNACINYPTVIAAMRLYHITGEVDYLDKAKDIYAWSKENLFNNSNGQVADHKIGDNPPGYEDYTYNQGTCIGAAVMLYQATDSSAYLDDAVKAADYTKNEMSDASGILPAEGDWNEQGVLKSIFAHYIHLLIEEADQDQYRAWIYDNINSAWRNRDTARGIMHRDYTAPCPTGVVQSYESSSGVAFMQLFDPLTE
ncbi:alpha-1,6-mannanase [Olivibacter sp. SDN3]|nr:alpha-1,6-mannanase [Olivibacter sp. SDN3]